MTERTTVLLEGLKIGESPRWHAGRLWFSNWGTGRLMTVDAAGHAETVLERDPSIFPFSADWLPDGRLLLTTGLEATVLRQELDGSLVTHADLRAISDIQRHQLRHDGG